MQRNMRVLALLFASLLAATAARAQEAAPLNLPISIDNIKHALSQPRPAEALKGLTVADAPTFRVDVTERQRFEDLLATIKFETPGTQIAGGNNAYEEYRRLFPPINNPLVQPYAAFSTGQTITLAVEALIEKYVAEKMAHVVGTALREQAEREARDEVLRSLAAYWASRSATPTVVSKD